ncbi:hypothetical protein MLD38_026509 [Melastoma candidum]|uniref:Uncharacterized protein n=1 Tax=Melastoma candidum TaxID=119954 RepID=A0ACB9P0P3_9MYRT|nr:hypothetical protein MLD38_026509 [Melastoma candidum]
MGKHERASSLVHASSSSIPPDERYRRRMWGLFHILNYHQWRSIKRRLQSKRHGSDKHSTGKGDPGSGSVAGLSEKHTRFAEDSEESSLNHSTKREPGRAGSKNSMRLRIRSLIPDDKFRHKGRHHRTSTAPGPLQSIRTNTDSSLEPTIDVSPTTLLKHSSSEHSALNETEAPSTSKTPPDGCIDQHDVDTPEKRQISSVRNSVENPEQHIDLQSPDYQSMNSINNLDVVEGINKELLLKFIRDAGAFSAQQRKEHKQKGRFQRSGTFPLPGLHTGNVGEENLPSHVEGARPPGPEERNSQDGNQATSLVEAEASGDVHREIDPDVEDDVPHCNTNRTVFAPVVVGNGRNHGKNQAVSKHLKAFKRKIQHAMKVNRKEKNRIAMDGILHRVPGDKEFSGELMEEMIRKWKEATVGRSDPTGQDDNKHSSTLGPRGVARTPSLEASLHKYAQLFESSFGAEAKCQGSSMVPASCPHNAKKLGRIASSPDIKFFSPNVDIDPETLSVKKPAEVSEVDDDATVKEECSSLIPDVGSESQPLLPASQETVLDEWGDAAILPKTLSMKKTVEVTKVDDNVTVEEECSSLIPDAGTESQPFVPASKEMVLDELGNVVIHPMETNDEVEVSTSKENLDENESSGALEHELFELPAAHDELSLEHEHSRGSSLFDILQDDTEEIGTDLQYLEERKTTGIDTKLDYIEREISSKELEDFIDAQIHLKDRDFFNYVRDVLEISGLSGKGSLGSLHPNNQPLDRAIYDEVEDIWMHEPGSSKNDEGSGNYDHVLLFDLINEVLFKIYERSFTYYPKTLSTLCRIHRMPGGHRVLEEVWTTISHYMSIEASLDQTMDYVTCKDLEKQDNWMNLQCDSEGVGIELEDMILDDLLDEMIFE